MFKWQDWNPHPGGLVQPGASRNGPHTTITDSFNGREPPAAIYILYSYIAEIRFPFQKRCGYSPSSRNSCKLGAFFLIIFKHPPGTKMECKTNARITLGDV